MLNAHCLTQYGGGGSDEDGDEDGDGDGGSDCEESGVPFGE